jgi:hypothetical protein
VTIDVFPRGVRAKTLWLNAFSRNGTATVTILNPFARMFTDVPIASVASLVGKMGNEPQAQLGAPILLAPARGSVRGIAATRYRLQYGPQAWIDVWTTDIIPVNPQLQQLRQQIAAGISPPTAAVARSIPGTPVYVELNFRRFKKVPLLSATGLAFDSGGEEEALTTGPLYLKAPLLDAIWK